MQPDGQAAPGIPWRVRTPRLVLRPCEPGEAAAFGAAIDASLAHLRAHLLWAVDEPSSLAAREARITRGRAAFLAGERFAFGIFAADDGRVLGGIGLEPVETDGRPPVDPREALEIGYWLRVGETGRGHVREAAGALSRVALALRGVARVEIHCDPRNRPSAAVPRALGYRLAETLHHNRLDPRGAPRDTMIWVLDAAAARVAPRAPLRVEGPSGETLLAEPPGWEPGAPG